MSEMASLASKPLDFKVLLKQAEENKLEANRKLDERRHRNSAKNSAVAPDRESVLNFIKRKKEKENELMHVQKVENKERLIRSLMAKRGGKKEVEVLLKHKDAGSDGTQKNTDIDHKRTRDVDRAKGSQSSNKVSGSKSNPNKKPVNFDELMKMAAVNINANSDSVSVGGVNKQTTACKINPSLKTPNPKAAITKETLKVNLECKPGEKRKLNGTPAGFASILKEKVSCKASVSKSSQQQNGKKPIKDLACVSKKIVKGDGKVHDCRPVRNLIKDNLKSNNSQNLKIDSEKKALHSKLPPVKKKINADANANLDKRNGMKPAKPVNNPSMLKQAKTGRPGSNNISLERPKMKVDSLSKSKGNVPIKAIPTATRGFVNKSTYRPKSKCNVAKSDSEVDSELDDFIDDEPYADMDQEEISNTIRSIFRYDKRSFRDMDDDDDDLTSMETSYRDIMKEEKRSARLGFLEDLEDIIREEREKKKLKKK